MEDPIEVQLPKRLQADIEARAKSNGRSVNDEIIKLLKSAVDTSGEALADQLAIRIQMLSEQLTKYAEQQAIHVSRDLWDFKAISRYLKRADVTVRTKILTYPTFPKPVRLPNTRLVGTEALYKAREVVAWAESFQATE